MTTAPSEPPPPQPATADTRADASAGPPLVLIHLAPPQEMARGVKCPACQTRNRFDSRPDKGYDAGRWWHCRNVQCKRVLGLLVVDSAGWTLLRLAAV